MYRGRFEGAQHSAQPAPTRRRRRRHNGRLTAMVAAVMLLLALAIGGTVAWLSTTDSPIQNRFLPSKVSCEVQEKFDGKVKTNVTRAPHDRHCRHMCHRAPAPVLVSSVCFSISLRPHRYNNSGGQNSTLFQKFFGCVKYSVYSGKQQPLAAGRSLPENTASGGENDTIILSAAL